MRTTGSARGDKAALAVLLVLVGLLVGLLTGLLTGSHAGLSPGSSGPAAATAGTSARAAAPAHHEPARAGTGTPQARAAAHEPIGAALPAAAIGTLGLVLLGALRRTRPAAPRPPTATRHSPRAPPGPAATWGRCPVRQAVPA